MVKQAVVNFSKVSTLKKVSISELGGLILKWISGAIWGYQLQQEGIKPVDDINLQNQGIN